MKKILLLVVVCILSSCSEDKNLYQTIYEGYASTQEQGVLPCEFILWNTDENTIKWTLRIGELGQPHITYEGKNYGLSSSILSLPLFGSKYIVNAYPDNGMGKPLQINDLQCEIPISYKVAGGTLSSVPNESNITIELKEVQKVYH